MRRLLLAVLLAAAVFAITSTTAAAAATITTTGTATLAVPNDLAHISAGIGLRRATPRAALAAAGSATRRLLAEIKAAGIPAADIQTSTISVHPTIRRIHHKRVRRYVAASTLDIIVRDVKQVGAVLAAAVNGGATSVSGPDFSLARSDAVYQRALGLALAQARAKAQALAQASGLILGRPASIDEGFSVTPAGDSGAVSSPKTPAPPTSPGTSEVEADVTVVFAAT